MKFAVIVATRGRPAQAAAVLGSARVLASGKHFVEYIIACDDDDLLTQNHHWEQGTIVSAAPRPLGPGACWNRCVAQTAAEVIVALPDDTIVATAGWDEAIAEAFEGRPAALSVLAWNDSASPGQATNIIAHRQWIEQVGHLYDDRFPFWFGDTAVNETYSFVTGAYIPIPDGLRLVHNGSSSNPRLRDMDLWWRFYGATRRERLQTAERIRGRLGLPTPANLDAIVAAWQQRDVIGLPASERIAADLKNAKAPDGHYYRAKQAALDYLGGLPMMMPRKQTICLCMIVKDEASIIERCLNSVKPLIDKWCIVDTGSTDGTQDIIRECMNGVDGKLIERPWVNFAHNRSEALEIARPAGCDYILVIDADDTVELAPGFVMPELTHDSYQVNIRLNGITYTRPQLVKSSMPWVYAGVVHEHLWCDEPGERSQGFIPGLTMIAGNDGARRRDPKAFERDAAAIEEAIRTETGGPPYQASRYRFYLGQSYRDAGQFEKAIAAYLERATMGYWREEVYLSLVEAARCMIRLDQPLERIVDTLGRAAAVVPQRSEGWFTHARYLRDKALYDDAWCIAARGLLVREPPPSSLFCEPRVYEWCLLDEFAISAYWSGRYKECRDACQALLKGDKLPEEQRPRVEANLRFALDQLGERAAA